jgi:propanediol utilization protein
MIKTKTLVEVSARHVHLSKKDFEKLFGKNAELASVKQLSQPKEFASDEKVIIINGSKKMENVRILGPFRKQSQAEIALTDAYHLNLSPLPKIKVSGDLANTTKVLVKGPKSSLKIPCIIAQRHLHCSDKEAKKIGLKNNQRISVGIEGVREVTFNNIVVRISPDYRLSLHLDTDEGNAAGIMGKTFGRIIK